MNRFYKNIPFLLLIIVSGIGLLVWLTNSFSILQTILGLLVVLFLPGYVLIELLMGRQTLGTIQHIFLTLSTSLAIAILGSLGLHQLPFGIRSDSWLMMFVGVTLGGGALAWLLRHRRRSGQRIAQRVPVRIHQLIFVGIAVLVAGEALNLARTPAAPDDHVGYTMLWMVPLQDESEVSHLQLGIDSKEFTSTQYMLEFVVNEQVIQEWERIELAPNQQWQATLALNQEQITGATLAANLYRMDAPDARYRHVVLRPRVSAIRTEVVTIQPDPLPGRGDR